MLIPAGLGYVLILPVFIFAQLKPPSMLRFLSLALIMVSLQATAQQRSMKDYLKHNCPTYYLGLDFTKAKMVGPDFNDPPSIINTLFRSWNNIVSLEADKYRVPQRLHDYNIRLEMQVVEKNNLAVNANDLVSYNSHRITEDDVRQAVKSLDLSAQKDGIGIVFVVEYFDKSMEEGSAYVAIVDCATNQVLHTERVTAKAGGFGFKAFWAKTIFGWLEHYDRVLYRRLETKYGK